MTYDRTVFLLSRHISDRLVLAQAFADHPDRLQLRIVEEDAFPPEKDGRLSFLIRAAESASPIRAGHEYVLGERPLRVGSVLDAVEAVLLKNSGAALEYGPFVLLSDRKCLRMGKREFELTDRETDIMAMLIRAGDAGCGRESMLEAIWNYRPDLDTHTVETHIYRLRQKIEDNPASPAHLLTTEKGYRLAV